MTQLLFRYYDREALDRQYQIALTVPEFSQIIAECGRRSMQAQETLPCRLAVPYGPTPAERLDIYPAAGVTDAPVLVFFHGGYWRMLDSADSAFMAETFTRAGVCVVVVNYALAQDAKLDEIVRQCRASVLWVADNISRHGGDPARIHVVGSSAGAHLAAMVGSADWGPGFDRPPPAVASLVLLSGIYDMSVVRLTYLNDFLSLDAQTAHDTSPINFLPPPGMPIIASYGESETDEFKRHTENYVAACRAHGSRVSFVAAPGTNHFDLALCLCDRESPVAAAMLGIMLG